MSAKTGGKKDCLWIVLFLIVFINGFEAGGYQASLWSVGKNFDLSVTSMGLYAAMELFAAALHDENVEGMVENAPNGKRYRYTASQIIYPGYCAVTFQEVQLCDNLRCN